jgi:hypothetical protein
LLKKYIILFSHCHEVFYLFKNKVLYMNYINKLCLCIATLVSFSCLGMMRQVIRDENGFRVFDGQQEHTVQPYFVDSLLKRMNPKQIQRFVERGNRIRAIRLSDGEYRLQAMVPVKGGGPISGLIAYWATKSLCYGAAATTAATAVVATGGTAVAFATGAAATVAGGAIAATAGTAVTVAGVTAAEAAGVIAGGLAVTTGMVEGAALATTAVAASAGGIAAAVAAVESASLAAGAFFAAIPFLP